MKQRKFFTFLLFFCSCIFTASAQNGNYNIKTIVLDAGHGGKDPGCHGGVAHEKNITLNIVKLVGQYIKENLPDVNIIYTRESDTFVELHERANIANRNKADVFISVHCNSLSSASYYGTETYVMGEHKSDQNLQVAKRENEVILKEKNYATHYEGFDPKAPDAEIVFSLFQNANWEQSILLAQKIENQFSSRAGRKSNGVKQAGFLVLWKTAMPSVLVECGYLTNSSEEKYLNSQEGQEYIASAIYRAFKEYKYAAEGKSEKKKTLTKPPKAKS